MHALSHRGQPSPPSKAAFAWVSQRDRYGRYLLPDPVTGEERAWTRATTWANTLADPWGIVDWKLRMAVKGVATRKDLYALASALPLTSGKKQLNEVARDAVEAAGGSSGRNLGTALHEWTAQVDRGEEPEIPAPWDRDVEAYTAALQTYGVRVTGYVEQIVCLPELGIAGTFDRIVVWDPAAYIADLKTGADLSYSWSEIAIQEAIYANGEYLWNDEREAWDPMPPVNREQGLVIHLPVGEAQCELWWVDLELGWMAVTLATDVREWRKRSDIARPFGVDLLGRSPVQPVLDLAGRREHRPREAAGATPAEKSPAAATAPEPDAPSPNGSDPAQETEGAGVTASSAPAPAGDST